LRAQRALYQKIAHGQRIVQTLDYLGRASMLIDTGDYMPPQADEVARALCGGQISGVMRV
jgi:hypothetical protein